MPTIAFAQSPGASNPSTDATLAQSLTTAPIPGQRGVAITAGGTMMEGRTTTRGWSLDGIAAFTTQSKWFFRFEAESAHTKYRIAPGQDLIDIEDHQLASALAMRPLEKYVSLIYMALWARDALLQLEHRAWVGGGIGFHLLQKPRINLLVAPLFEFGDEHRSFTEAADNVVDIGVLQSLTVKPNANFTVEGYLAAHSDVTNSRDSSTTFNVSVTSKLVKYLNLKVFYQYEYAELVPQGADPVQTTAGVALQVAYTRTPTPPAAQAPPSK